MCVYFVRQFLTVSELRARASVVVEAVLLVVITIFSLMRPRERLIYMGHWCICLDTDEAAYSIFVCATGKQTMVARSFRWYVKFLLL